MVKLLSKPYFKLSIFKFLGLLQSIDLAYNKVGRPIQPDIIFFVFGLELVDRLSPYLVSGRPSRHSIGQPNIGSGLFFDPFKTLDPFFISHFLFFKRHSLIFFPIFFPSLFLSNHPYSSIKPQNFLDLISLLRISCEYTPRGGVNRCMTNLMINDAELKTNYNTLSITKECSRIPGDGLWTISSKFL